MLSPLNDSLDIVKNHENVGIHGVVRVGPEGHPGVDFKVNMQNIYHKLLILRFLLKSNHVKPLK